MGIPLRVLIAEDSEGDTQLMLHELKRGGYDPVYKRVNTPLGLIDALDEANWDILIGDHSMPHLDTVAALTILKERGLDLPYIIVSGTIDEKVAVAAMRAGAHDFLRKDNLSRLVPAIERELRRMKEQRLRHEPETIRRDQEERFRGLVENMSDIVAILDENGVIGYLNPAVEEIVGYKPEELIGKNALEIVHMGDSDRLTHILEEKKRELGSTTRFEFRFRHKNGTRRVLEGIGKNLLDVPFVGGVLVTCRDITDRKRDEEARERQINELERFRGHLEKTAVAEFHRSLQKRGLWNRFLSKFLNK